VHWAQTRQNNLTVSKYRVTTLSISHWDNFNAMQPAVLQPNKVHH